MKRIISLFMLMGMAVLVQAQQRPHYTQYVINPFIINPAIAGIDNYADLKMSVRDQWTGLNGAPKTTYLTIHGPIGKDDYRTSSTSFQVPGRIREGRLTGKIIPQLNRTMVPALLLSMTGPVVSISPRSWPAMPITWV